MRELFVLFLLYTFLTACNSAEAQESALGGLPPKSPPQEVLSEIEKARAKAEEARPQAESFMATIKKSIKDLEMELRKAEEESIQAMTEREALFARKAVGLESVVTSQLEEATKERVQILGDKLQVLRERLVSEEELQKTRDNAVTLLERKAKLAEEVAATPAEKAATALKEVGVAEAYLQAADAKLKEKEAYLKGLKEEFKEVQQKVEVERERLKKELKTLEELPFRKEEGPQRFVYLSKLLLQIHLANINDNTKIAEERVELAEAELERAKIETSNAQLRVALLEERASLLEERLKAEEFQKKEEEAKTAERAEEEKKKTAGLEKAIVQKEKEEALRKAEELTQQQQAAASPEQKRVLELESQVFALHGEVAKRKDTLITEGTSRYEDNTEYKKLARDIHTTLAGGEKTPSEVQNEMLQLGGEAEKWKKKLKAVESLEEAAQKEGTLLAEQLQQARSELAAPPGESSKIAKEAETFVDKALASKLITHSQEKVKLLEEEGQLITAWVARIEERKGIIHDALSLLNKAMKELSEVRAANIWARREWMASWLPMKEGMEKLLSIKRGSDVVTFIENPAQRNVRISLSGAGVLTLLAAAIFAWYYCKRWCRLNLKRLEEAGQQNYIKASLLPALFRVLQEGVTLWLVLGLCFGIAALFEIKGPLIDSVKYGLIVFSIYKVLHSFLVEAVGFRGWGKPLLALPPSLAQHSYLTLHVILLYSAIFITLTGVLGSFGPKTGEILLRVYSLSVPGLFIWFVAPKPVFLALLADPVTRLKKFQRGCIHVAHPLVIAFLVFVIVLNSMGYVTMTYALIGTSISCVITVVSVAVARKLITAFILDRLARKRVNEEKVSGSESETGTEGVPVFKVTRAVVDYFSIIVSIIVIVSLWIATLADFASTPAAPEPLKDFASEVGRVLKITAGVLGYQLGLGEGGYTTPFKIIIGLILVGISFLVAAAIKRLFQRRLLTKLGLERGIEATISSIITYVIIAFSILFAMSVAGVPLRSLAFFAGALGIGIGFGLQNIINNFVSGIIILFERPVRVGDIVILSPELGGTVERIGPRSTTIVTADNVAVVVPNSKLMDSEIVNWSQPSKMLRVHIFVGVAYGSDLELVKKCLLEVAREHHMVRKYPEPMVRFDKFGDSSLNFELIYWVDGPYERWITLSELNFAIDKTFREHNITIPFPQQDVYIRTVATPAPDIPKETKESKDKGPQ